MSGQRGQRIGEGREIPELRGTDPADICRSDLGDAGTENFHRGARAEPRGWRRQVNANGNVGRHFVGDLV